MRAIAGAATATALVVTRRMRTLSAALLLVAAAGCAHRNDWIEGTLVTVDVSGVWTGTAQPTRAGAWPYADATNMELTLAQRGPKVTGECQIRTTKVTIEGTVRGDVLSFAASGGRMHAQATVDGDAMSGEGVGWQNFGQFTLKLSRQR